jgi:hypothetical protein
MESEGNFIEYNSKNDAFVDSNGVASTKKSCIE